VTTSEAGEAWRADAVRTRLPGQTAFVPENLELSVKGKVGGRLKLDRQLNAALKLGLRFPANVPLELMRNWLFRGVGFTGMGLSRDLGCCSWA
jgi:hypothetical protein